MTVAERVSPLTAIKFISIERLRPSEMVNPGRVRNLATRIQRHGFWTQPLLVETENQIIMDGHHRLECARALKLRRLPCALMSYADPRVSVFSWHKEDPFDVSQIIEAGLSGQLLGFKTTRHRIEGGLPTCAIPLEQLTGESGDERFLQ